MFAVFSFKLSGQCVEKQAAPPKIFGYSSAAYSEISPPMLEPATKVSARRDEV